MKPSTRRISAPWILVGVLFGFLVYAANRDVGFTSQIENYQHEVAYWKHKAQRWESEAEVFRKNAQHWEQASRK